VAQQSLCNGVGERAVIADSEEAEEKTGPGDVQDRVSRTEAVVE